MGRLARRKAPNALLAFGRSVSVDAFDDLTTARGWKTEMWQPTFVDPSERDELAERPPQVCPDGGREPSKRVLRLHRAASGESGAANEIGPRIVVASSSQLPTLDYVEWHYIEFVLSCLGSVSEAARILGVRRSTLQRKRKKTPPMR